MNCPSRRDLLRVSGVGFGTALAGCNQFRTDSQPSDGDETEPGDVPSIADRFKCENASRPEPDAESGVEREWESGDGQTSTTETVGSANYPSPPDDFADHYAVREYVTSHEGAYMQNQEVARIGERLFSFGVSTLRPTVEEADGGILIVRFIVDWDLEMMSESNGQWGPLAASGAGDVAYAVDESGMVRLFTQYTDDEEPPDPLTEGELLACF